MKTVLIRAPRMPKNHAAGTAPGTARRTLRVDLDARSLLNLLLESKTDSGILTWEIEPPR